MRRVYVCLLRRLPVAEFGQRKVAVTHLCTFDRGFRMVEQLRTVMGGRLSPVAEAIVRGYLECVLKVIYRSTYVGIVFRFLNFETSNLCPSTSKFIVITTSMMLRQLIFR